MKLFMKEQVFSLKGRFTIKDEFENDKYFVEGEFPSFGKKLHVYDINNNEVAFIKQKPLSLMGRYEVYVGGELVTTIKGKLSFIKDKLFLEDLNWNVSGNISSHEYVVTDTNNEEIVRVTKAWFSWGDSYELDIYNNKAEILGLAIVLAIDCVLAAKAAAASSS